ncbi:hypothetical protein [Corynebacterium pilosum]|uniref:Uncharacterized protein n=2 Tax=Corynebacterium pilosum TaxID=35756 RepID=A0A376CJ65_9CORY|nr:hypothetical protein [Corynebacterium pilosum]STC68292.1 Uncharacterised protein [Corynebacterium pilosum]
MNEQIPTLPVWLAIHIGRTPWAESYPINRAGMNKMLTSVGLDITLEHTTITEAEMVEAAGHAATDPAAATLLMVQVIAANSGSSLRGAKQRLRSIATPEAQEKLREIAATANEDVAAAYTLFRTGSRNNFSHIGPAMFTRYLAAVTPEAFVLDSQVATNLNRAGVDIDPVGPWNTASYSHYIEVLYTWAGQHHDPADLELALLNCPTSATEMEFSGDTGRMLAHLLGVERPAPTTWGMHRMDKKFGRLRTGTVTVVYGKKGSGVTSLLRTIALGNSARGLNVDFITEMDSGDAWSLMLAGATGMSVEELTDRDNASRNRMVVDKAPQLPGTIRILAAPDPETRAEVIIDDRTFPTDRRRKAPPVPEPRHGIAYLMSYPLLDLAEDADIDAFLRLERPDLHQGDHKRAGEIDCYDTVNNRGIVLANALHCGRVTDKGR